jgi:hypothetical protein
MELSTTEMSLLLGISAVQINKLAKRGVLKQLRRGVFDGPASVQGYLLFREEALEARINTGEYGEWRTRLMKQKALDAEREARVRSGELVEVKPYTDAIIEQSVKVAQLSKTRYLGLPSKLAARHGTFKTPGDLFTYATKEARAALTLLAQDILALRPTKAATREGQR